MLFRRLFVKDRNTQKSKATLPIGTGSATIDPSVTFKSVTFSDGTTIALESTDIIVFVGPNNAGKSMALRELHKQAREPFEGAVIKAIELRRIGILEDLIKYICQHTQVNDDGYREFKGYRISIGEEFIESSWSRPNELFALTDMFCLRLETETRITDSNPSSTLRTLEDIASHPIQMLYLDDELENKIRGYFRQAFGEDLIVYLRGGDEIPLMVGRCPVLENDENRTSTSYCDRLLAATVPLKKQGDGMRSFASVILHLLAPITPSILMLDEPEAFLHPPQAKLLGELIANERSPRAQLFVATHSPDVLNGLLNVAPDNLRVLRIQREGMINHVKVLDKERTKEISTDPLMKYSSVLSGVFHERVIICESDADCMFYSSILDLQEIHGDRQPDVLFIHASGKGRMAKLAKALIELGVSVDIIADIDILREGIEGIVKTLGGDWKTVQPIVKKIKDTIENHKPWLNAEEIRTAILEKLGTEPLKGEFSKEKRSGIEAIFKKASPWDAVKEAGESAIPAGEGTRQFQELQHLCKQIGLWIVPVGELEGFCKSVGGHGPKWVQQVIEQYDLASDSDLQKARDFVREIWISRNTE